jgi:hypothetical protein
MHLVVTFEAEAAMSLNVVQYSFHLDGKNFLIRGARVLALRPHNQQCER